MFICSICGQHGGSYCPTVESESGEALESYCHPICLANQRREIGIAEATTLKGFGRRAGERMSHPTARGFVPIRRTWSTAFPRLKKNTLHKVWL